MSKILKIRMLEQDVTTSDIATCFRVSDRTVRNWLRKPQSMTAGRLGALADILHLTNEELAKVAKEGK